MKRDGRCAEKPDTPSSCRHDGRDDPARQQAAAHRLWAAYLMATHSNGILPCRETARYLLRMALGSLAHKLRASMVDPERNPLSGLVGRGQREDPPTGGQGRSHDGKMLIVGAIELGDGACGWRSPPTAPPTSDIEPPPIPTPSRKPTAGPATLRSPPIATMSMSSGRPPLTSSCRSTKSSPTLKDGREASTTASQASAGLSDEFVFRFNRRKTRHAAFRSLFRLATNAEPLTYSMLIEPEPCA